MPYDVSKPIAWVGADKKDRLLIHDRTKYGLNRRVVARKGEMMDTVLWISTCMAEALRTEVRWWVVEVDEFWFLWIVWKDKK